jgi:hypothetical protein
MVHYRYHDFLRLWWMCAINQENMYHGRRVSSDHQIADVTLTITWQPPLTNSSCCLLFCRGCNSVINGSSKEGLLNFLWASPLKAY